MKSGLENFITNEKTESCIGSLLPFLPSWTRTVTLNGTGAFLGLSKVVNGAELGSPGEAPASITYQIELTDGGTRMEIDIQIAGDGWWSFTFVKQ